MSKVQGGPAASSFTNPRKTGWLYKHGGSGISSHWKKRWFIADDHYLFYYKTPNDKKPVGILCLPEYGSCQKADVKEWKKSFSFILGRTEGVQENTDVGSGGSSAGKDYVLYSDSEGDMNAWIEALQEEMKSSASYIDGVPSNYGSSNKVKVDQKALDEVTKAANDGPKLTHLTAQRPKVRGRRPPKRYATYHEEDKDDSPPDTPTSDHNATATQTPLSPSASPTSKSKGHRPAVPLMPKQRSVTASPPPTPSDIAKGAKKLPVPPAKPTQEKEEIIELDVTPVPKQRPVPPKRPLKPRAATEMPVAAPRPRPAPRKVAGKEGTSSPARELAEAEREEAPRLEKEQSETEKEVTGNELSSSPGNHTNEQKIVQEIIPEVRVTEQEEVEQTVQHRAEDKLPSDSTETLEVVQEENVTHDSVAKEDKDASEDGSELRRSSSDEYELMKSGVTKKGSSQYQKSVGSEEPDISCAPPQKEAEYTTPSPVTKQMETTYDLPHATRAGKVVVSPAPQIALVASENEENLTTGRGKSSAPPQNEEQLKPFKIERDALGYSKVMKQKSKDNRVRSESPSLSDEEPPPPPLWTGMDTALAGNDVPSTLHQAREILHLAQVMKKEIKDMRREVQRELELARRERQDAELIKKNATEILRMAKEKLHHQKNPA